MRYGRHSRPLAQVGRPVRGEPRPDCAIPHQRRVVLPLQALYCSSGDRDVLDGIKMEITELLDLHLKTFVKDAPDDDLDLTGFVESSSALSNACRHNVCLLSQNRLHGLPFLSTVAPAEDMDEENVEVQMHMNTSRNWSWHKEHSKGDMSK